MAEAQPYELEHREVVAEAPNLRVSILTLAAEQCVPWLYHSEIIDTFFCVVHAQFARRPPPENLAQQLNQPLDTDK